MKRPFAGRLHRPRITDRRGRRAFTHRERLTPTAKYSRWVAMPSGEVREVVTHVRTANRQVWRVENLQDRVAD